MIRLQSDAELEKVFPLMAQLREHLKNADDFVHRVRLGEASFGYMLFGLEVSGEVISLCGIQPMDLHCLSSRRPTSLPGDAAPVDEGRCLSVRDLVTDCARRSRGYGGQLLAEVEEWSGRNGYGEITLSSGARRKDAHAFLTDRMAFSLKSHTFRKSIDRSQSRLCGNGEAVRTHGNREC